MIIKRCLRCGEVVNLEWRLEHLFKITTTAPVQLCPACRSKFTLRSYVEPFCNGCSRQIQLNSSDKFHQAYLIDNQEYCYDCTQWLKKYSKKHLNHRVLFEYSEEFKKWLEDYKYMGDVRQVQVILEQLKVIYKDYNHFEWLVLPSQPKVLLERGFHPVAYLLSEARIPFQIPFEYVGKGERQALKSRHARVTSSNPFILNEDCLIDVNKTYLLFDDVYTTGTTLMHAKSLLYQSFDGIQINSLSLVGEQQRIE